jgi:hypothetical protein
MVCRTLSILPIEANTMGRKNRSRNHDHHHGSTTHHHDHDQSVTQVKLITELDVEIESTGEVIEIVEVQEYISTTGRGLADYPVVREFETPEQIERRRQATIDEQQAQVSTIQNDEDVQIDRYRSLHRAVPQVGKPHEMIDDEIEISPEDFNDQKTAEGGVVVNPLAHEKAGLQQNLQARHAAFKRRLGLGSEDACVSPVSGSQKK